MAPFPPAAAAPSEANVASVPGEHRLRLELGEPSWVEITAADGTKLEYGLLPAGSVRSYHSAQALEVRLGNVNGATVEIDGKAADLAPFRRANVAHFRLVGGQAALPHSGG